MKLICWAKCIYNVNDCCTNSNIQHVAGMRIDTTGMCSDCKDAEQAVQSNAVVREGEMDFQKMRIGCPGMKERDGVIFCDATKREKECTEKNCISFHWIYELASDAYLSVILRTKGK